MANYIDGFVFPVPRNHLNEYRRVAKTVAEIWKEHGAIDYFECVGDDLHFEGIRSFVDVLSASEDEAILFGWVVFESREARDLANAKVPADPRMEELMSASDTGFDPQRMVYGGFQQFVPAAK